MCLYVPVIKSQGQHFDGNISVAMSFCLSDYQEAQVTDRNSQEELVYFLPVCSWYTMGEYIWIILKQGDRGKG